MSAGGINVQQPLVAARPTNVGGVQPGGEPPLRPATAAGPMPTPVPASPAATVPTGFGPVAGVQAGSVAPSGGLVEDGLPRTAAIATGVAANAYGRAASASAAAATIAGQQVVDPATTRPAAGAGTPAGPAAWDESWAKRFRYAGAPSEIIQQLTFTGAMGADAAQLEEMLGQVKGQVDGELAKFAHDHPEAFRKLRGNPAVDRAMLVQVAAGVNAGQVPKEQLEQLVDSVGKSQGRVMFDTLVKPMIVWSLIPGWGAIRLGFAPFTGGRDPLTGEKMFADKLSTTFSVLAGIGGGITLFNHARGAMQVAQGHRLVAAGGDAARIAAAEGVANITGAQKLASFLPGTHSNRVFSGISRMDQNLTSGINALKPGSIERELAENLVAKWRSGEISILGDPASKWTKMGFQPNARGILLGRNKAMATAGTTAGRPTITLDGRMTGKAMAAHLASAGVEFADDTVGNNMLKSRLFGQLGPGAHLDANAVKLLREQTLGNATKQLLDAGFLGRPSGMQKVFGAVRPGPLQDALWAADNVNAGTLGKLHGTAAIPKLVKFGGAGLLAAGVGYFAMVKPQMDAARKQQAEAAEAQGAQQQAGAQGPAGAQQQVTPELQAALQQFGALPKAQQAQIIQQQYATLQQASQQPNLTAEQQQQIAAAAAELELFMQVANAAAPAAGTATAAPGGAAPAAPAASAAPTAGPGFTARGLGLG